jgi:tetratricopeptide (TPR) repeat protein
MIMEQHGWYVVENNQPVGPESLSNLKAKIGSGAIAPTDLVYHKEIGWKEASSVPELGDVFRNMLSHTPSEPRETSASGSTDISRGFSSLRMKRMIVGVSLVLVVLFGFMIFNRPPKQTSAKLVEPEETVEKIEIIIEETLPPASDTANQQHLEKTDLTSFDSVMADLREERRKKIAKLLIENSNAGQTLAIEWKKEKLYDLLIIAKSIEDIRDTTRPEEPATDEKFEICGMLDFESGNFEGALENLGKVTDLENYPDARQYLGLTFFWLADYNQALEHLEKTLDEKPGDLELNLAYIETLRQLNRDNSLKPIYNNKISRNQDSSVLNYIHALFTDDVPTAMAGLSDSIGLDRQFVPAYYELARRMLIMKQAEDARRVVNKLMIISRDVAALDVLDAEVHYLNEDYSKAVESAGKALDKYKSAGETSGRIWADLVTVKSLIDDNKTSQAKSYLRQLGKYDNGNPDIAVQFALIYNKIARAEDEFRSAIDILIESKNNFSNCSPALAQELDFELGLTYLEAQDHKKAIKQFSLLTVEHGIYSSYPIAAVFWKGMAHELSGDHDQAKAQWEIMASTFPSENYPGIAECLCSEYMSGAVKYEALVTYFENTSMLRRALISYSIGLKAYNRGKLVPARKFFITSLACLNERRNLPWHLVQRSMNVIEKSLIVPD